MANGIINLILKSASVGSGFDNTLKQTDDLIARTNDLSRASNILGKAFGNVGNLAGQMFANILKGGIWGAAAEGVKFLIGKYKEHKEAVEKSLEAERKAFDERVKKIDEYSKAIERADKAAAKANARIDALAKERDEISRTIKAELELERQRRISKGENPDEVNANIDARAASDARFDKARKAAEEQRKAENSLAAEREKAKLGEAAVNKLMEERRRLVYDIHRRAQTVWAEENEFAARNGIQLKEPDEAAYMAGRGDKDYEEKKKQLESLNTKIAAEQDAQAKRVEQVANAEKGRLAALERVRAVEVENHAAQLKEANEKAEAERKVAEEIDKQQDAIYEKLEADRDAEAQRKQDAADREQEFIHMLEDEERERMDAEEAVANLIKARKDLEAKPVDVEVNEPKPVKAVVEVNEPKPVKAVVEVDVKGATKEKLRERAREELANVKKIHKARMEALDKEIAKAKEEAAVWEQNSQRARDFARNNGGGFAAWNAVQRDEARKKERGDRKQANAVKVAEDEWKRLARESEKRGDKMNPLRRRRMEELAGFLELNRDPNKGERKVKALEEKRRRAEEKMQKDVADIAVALKNGGVNL